MKKHISFRSSLSALVAGSVLALLPSVQAAGAATPSAPPPAAAALSGAAQPAVARVGTYDSRIVAFAYFWSSDRRQQLAARAAAGKKAKATGDEAAYRAIADEMKAAQARLHLQVFSTAPIDEILAAMSERVATVKREAGVVALVSQWDEAALARHGGGERIDVTDALLQGLALDEPRRKTIAEMKKRPPLPLAEAQRLEAAGKL